MDVFSMYFLIVLPIKFHDTIASLGKPNDRLHCEVMIGKQRPKQCVPIDLLGKNDQGYRRNFINTK